MLKIKKIIILFFFIISSTYLNAENSTNKKEELLFYIGITMVNPINELAKNFEKIHNCKINILQGGSQDLYDSIKMSKKGDLYLPGSQTYRLNNLNDGLLLDSKLLGFNKLAIIVKKGNPKNIKASLDELTNENLRVVLGNATSGSVGNATKKILLKYGNYKEALLNSIFLASDSRNLTRALVDDKADLIVNWYATSFWPRNKDHVDALVLEDKFSNKSELLINLLSVSKNKVLARKFMDYASSKEGKEVFKKYGFLED